jgi:UDP-N-acetylglucosamine 4,6-dehydratase
MRVFVTGITGSLGTAVTKELLKNKNIRIFGYSRDEHRQKKFIKDSRITLILGDIRDKDRLLESTRRMDIIFHFAALKHVDLLESNPEESIKTNVIGTENILYAQRLNKIERVVLSSTDKAALPINTYGFCKALAEKLVLRNQNNVVCRYGNVLASNGSVVPLFVKSLRDNGEIDLTDSQMNRFFISLEDAAKFVVDCGLNQKGGLHIPEMKSAQMKDVADTIAKVLEIKKYKTKIVGIRPGEKISECLRAPHEGVPVFSDTAKKFSAQELEKILTPIVRSLA